MTLTTWAGNLAYHHDRLHRPTSIEQLQDVVAGSDRIRALGTRHSFNDLADTTGDLVQLHGLPPQFEVDAEARTVLVSAGARYGTVAEELDRQGWALGNLASLPHISVGGAVATGTHGSGDRSRNLSAAVAGLDLVTADGELLRLRRGDGLLDGAVVGLGALGVAVRVLLDIEPAYDVAQEVHLDLPWAAVLDDLDAITGSADSVSLFTDWVGPAVRQVWRKTRLPRGGEYRRRPDLFGARPAPGPVHPLPGIDPVHCTEQLGVPGPWHQRLPHFRLDFTPSNGEELQSEYLVPRANAVPAIEAMRGLGPVIAPLLQVSEVRTVAADDLWLSSASGGDRVGLHLTWQPRQAEVEAVLPAIEAALYPLGARPHWGKLFHAVDGPASWARWDDFRALRGRLDPERVFGNGFLTRHGLD
ncbi:FAD-binding protein [Cellulomonas denverensis]|uniref:FAD-binding protein n=1 Tax=Cellulomonas denverensis TaxID=264297 RepID=A0A7X6KS02_9CELL|nr:FAD-binding protein [Cellulomonas denverensis]NKY21196.1 FAD-binding protein [Cellulomonas denverensis]GIG24486.1 xylitol oxidase [Cellulomonas denverensis]